jgi:hypothetical protein
LRHMLEDSKHYYFNDQDWEAPKGVTLNRAIGEITIKPVVMGHTTLAECFFCKDREPRR